LRKRKREGGREGEERRERSSLTSTLERERKGKNEIFWPHFKINIL
jgi:hypothetical protein